MVGVWRTGVVRRTWSERRPRAGTPGGLLGGTGGVRWERHLGGSTFALPWEPLQGVIFLAALAAPGPTDHSCSPDTYHDLVAHRFIKSSWSGARLSSYSGMLGVSPHSHTGCAGRNGLTFICSRLKNGWTHRLTQPCDTFQCFLCKPTRLAIFGNGM